MVRGSVGGKPLTPRPPLPLRGEGEKDRGTAAAPPFLLPSPPEVGEGLGVRGGGAARRKAQNPRRGAGRGTPTHSVRCFGAHPSRPHPGRHFPLGRTPPRTPPPGPGVAGS